ncbi:MAG: hypothetical protein QOE70_940 [Chthoniobacter sp.]|jgi:hypothetical protein|nr:hypothetical protein [Chthoniobacter sp.]
MIDRYALKARLQPGLMALFPLLIGATALFGPGIKLPGILTAAAGAAGLTFLLGRLARNRGKQVEPALWKLWGGTPTTLLLRHTGPGNAVLRERWQKQLSTLTGKALPTLAGEQKDPESADAIYEAATRLLIGKTRDEKRFPFVYRDNVNYGFCRNLYGLKPVGIAFSLVALAASGYVLWQATKAKTELFLPVSYLVMASGSVAFWSLVVTPAWVRIPAMNYAQHLFEALEILKTQRAAKTK